MEYIKAKTIVTKNKSTVWFGTDYTMNIYKGCCHGCIYCDSRSDCYRIDDFDKVRVKENALEIIRNDLRRKVMTGVVGTGAMSDPYNPFEKKLNLTGNALQLINAFEFGVAIATKSDLITRDIDILECIVRHSPVICKITITTYDDVLASQLEPYAPSSSRRFEAIRKLSEANIFSGILLMPVLPFIEDNSNNIISIVKRAAECGAKFIYPAFGMTLRENQRLYYFDKLNELYPDSDYVVKYINKFGNSYQCTSPNAKKLWYEFKNLCEKYSILYDMKSIINGYKRKYKSSQLSIFD